MAPLGSAGVSKHIADPKPAVACGSGVLMSPSSMREWMGEGDTATGAEETLSASSCNVDMGVAKPLPELTLSDVGLALP